MTLPLDQVKVIDADTHMTERHDLWTSRAPAAFKDRVPHVTQVDGAATWVVEGDVVLGRAGAGGVVDKHGNKGRSFEGLYEWEIEQAPRGRRTTPSRAWSCSTRSGSGRRSSSRASSGSAARRSATSCKDPELRNLCLEIFNDANAELQAESGNRLLPMAILPAWDIDACVREVQRAQGSRPARRQPHLRSAGSRFARPREPRVGPGVGGVRVVGDAGALPHRCEPHDDELLRRVPVGLARRRHQARDRRRAAVHRERACRRQHDLFGDVRPLPRAQDRVGRERHRLDPVHPRGARLRDGRERAAGQGAHVAAAVGVLQAEHLRHHVVRAPQPRRAHRRRSARTTSCSRPTSRTRRACTPTR